LSTQKWIGEREVETVELLCSEVFPPFRVNHLPLSLAWYF